jgi:hypothetical protein
MDPRLAHTGGLFRRSILRKSCPSQKCRQLTARKCETKRFFLHIPRRTGTGWLGRKGSNLRMLESKSSALPLGDAPPGSPRIKPAGPRRKPPQPPAKCPARQGFWGRLRGWGGIVIRAPPEARGNPFALVRRVAQPGRALRSGRRGRRFESSLSDQFFNGLAPLLLLRSPCVGDQWEFRR